MKKIYKDWNLFEILFLIFGLSAIVLSFIFVSDRNILSFVASLIGVVAALAQAKGLIISQFIGLVYSVLYAVVAITDKYYGEAIIYFGLMIPIAIVSIVTWLKNRNKENKDVVTINKIQKREVLFLSIGTVVATIAFYFLLRALGTNQLIVSTISLISSAVAGYLVLRRSKYYALAYFANDVILIILWGLSLTSGSLEFLPTLLCICVFFINDIYAFINWGLEEKRQIKIENKS